MQNNRYGDQEIMEYACEVLQQKGYEILNRKYINKWGGVDIVAKEKGSTSVGLVETIVFVQVKSIKVKYPQKESFGDLLEQWKIEQTSRIGEGWVQEYDYTGKSRVDMIVVSINEVTGELGDIEHWENVG